MREDDFAERAVLALERIADALSVIVGIFIASEPEDEDEPVIHAEHGTPQ